VTAEQTVRAWLRERGAFRGLFAGWAPLASAAVLAEAHILG
jgi:hypothetical protein